MAAATELARRYEVRIIPTLEGRFSVELPDWPTVITSGDTHEEALANAIEALEFAIETCREQHHPLPEPYRVAH